MRIRGDYANSWHAEGSKHLQELIIRLHFTLQGVTYVPRYSLHVAFSSLLLMLQDILFQYNSYVIVLHGVLEARSPCRRFCL